jgi:uncharacterized membrane protein YGL010W
MKLHLNAEWSELMRQYERDHQDPRNQLCHSLGIPLIAASLPVGLTIVGLPLSVGMFTMGWGFQFMGHVFERQKPTFVSDKRALVAGLLWWSRKVGLDFVELEQRAPTTLHVRSAAKPTTTPG